MDGFYFYGFDSLYLILVMPAILLVVWSQIKVKSSFSKYSKFFCQLTGEQTAQKVLEANGIYNVKIERVNGNLTDHYDPKTNVIRLSDSVFSANSIAAVGVAAHEAGHAVQYAKGYIPIKTRAVIFPVCNLCSQLSVPLLLIGLLFNFSFLVNFGIIFFTVALIFQLITLPIEFNASRRALSAIKNYNLLTNEADYKGAKKVLSAAAMTYIASFLVSLAQLLRFIAIANRRR